MCVCTGKAIKSKLYVGLALLWMFHSSYSTALSTLPNSDYPEGNWADNGICSINQPNPLDPMAYPAHPAKSYLQKVPSKNPFQNLCRLRFGHIKLVKVCKTSEVKAPTVKATSSVPSSQRHDLGLQSFMTAFSIAGNGISPSISILRPRVQINKWYL